MQIFSFSKSLNLVLLPPGNHYRKSSASPQFLNSYRLAPASVLLRMLARNSLVWGDGFLAIHCLTTILGWVFNLIIHPHQLTLVYDNMDRLNAYNKIMDVYVFHIQKAILVQGKDPMQETGILRWSNMWNQFQHYSFRTYSRHPVELILDQHLRSCKSIEMFEREHLMERVKV